MPNQLKMSKIQSVLALRQRGWTFTRIANELGIHRETVAQYVHQHSKPTEAPTGSEEPKPAQAPIGSVGSKPTEAPRSSLSEGSGRSDCEPLRAVIESKLDQGLHARRIYQDLVEEHGFAGSYWSVMRFVRRLGRTRELPFRRMNVSRAKRPRSISAVGPRSSTARGVGTRRMSFALSSATAAGDTARRSSARTRRASSAVWKTPSSILAAASRPW